MLTAEERLREEMKVGQEVRVLVSESCLMLLLLPNLAEVREYHVVVS